MSFTRVFQINAIKGSLLPKTPIVRSCCMINRLPKNQNGVFNKQIRMYSRRARYQYVEPNFYNTFLKPTLFVVGGVGGMSELFVFRNSHIFSCNHCIRRKD